MEIIKEYGDIINALRNYLKTESQSKNERRYTYVDSFDVVSFSYPFF